LAASQGAKIHRDATRPRKNVLFDDQKRAASADETHHDLETMVAAE